MNNINWIMILICLLGILGTCFMEVLYAKNKKKKAFNRSDQAKTASLLLPKTAKKSIDSQRFMPATRPMIPQFNAQLLVDSLHEEPAFRSGYRTIKMHLPPDRNAILKRRFRLYATQPMLRSALKTHNLPSMSLGTMRKAFMLTNHRIAHSLPESLISEPDIFIPFFEFSFTENTDEPVFSVDDLLVLLVDMQCCLSQVDSATRYVYVMNFLKEYSQNQERILLNLPDNKTASLSFPSTQTIHALTSRELSTLIGCLSFFYNAILSH